MTLTFLDDIETVYSGEYFYDVTDGGHIRPENMLVEEDAKKVQEALDLVCEFFRQAEANGCLEEM